jgi:aspartate carbamoyltransferase regulatory subunit
VIRCKNPRCITAIEQEIEQVFRLTREAPPLYRCAYCETAYSP